MLKSLLAISAGASLGAILRWGLGLALNATFPLIPLGTLTANLLGGFCMGLAMGAFALFPSLGSEWRLLVITGFLGSLTTFSTYSAEVVALIQKGRFLIALAAVLIHNAGALLMTFLGMGAFAMLRGLARQ